MAQSGPLKSGNARKGKRKRGTAAMNLKQTGRALVRAVTLDVGGTLIQPWPSVGHVYAAVASECGVSGLAPESLNHQFKLAWAARAPFDYSRAAWRELVNRTFAGLTP